MAKLNIVSFLCGILFSVGLGISGMTQPQKVIGFLDVFGEWDLSLAFVMCGAVLSYLVLQFWIHRKFSMPLLGESFQIPTSKDIDRSLIIGAMLFLELLVNLKIVHYLVPSKHGRIMSRKRRDTVQF